VLKFDFATVIKILYSLAGLFLIICCQQRFGMPTDKCSHPLAGYSEWFLDSTSGIDFNLAISALSMFSSVVRGVTSQVKSKSKTQRRIELFLGTPTECNVLANSCTGSSAFCRQPATAESDRVAVVVSQYTWRHWGLDYSRNDYDIDTFVL
jgi:hypothetical protein